MEKDIQHSLDEIYGRSIAAANAVAEAAPTQHVYATDATSSSTSTGSKVSNTHDPASNEMELCNRSTRGFELTPGSLHGDLGRDFAVTVQEPKRDSRIWVRPCFRSTVFGAKVIHEDVSGGKYDSDMFTRFRQLYFAERSWWRRFFELKEVKEISVVKASKPCIQTRETSINIWQFDLLPLEIATIRAKDQWPPEAQREVWKYAPCPPGTIPLVSRDILIHIWRNLHYADELVYQRWLQEQYRLSHALEWLRILPMLSRRFGSEQSRPPIAPRNPELPIPPRRSMYIFNKILKKAGDMLEPNYGDDSDDAPEGWGLLFEEGFRIHRLLIALLFLYFFVSLAVIIWVLRTFGVVGPTTWTGMFGILAWFTSFFSLFLTVWFKWAESG